MSCFVMYENRIASLANGIIDRNKGSLLVGEQGETYDRERLADAMLAMNLDAFRQRYGMRALLAQDLEYIDLDTRNWKPQTVFSEVQFFKTLQCFLYQCCEGNVDDKPLYKTLDAIKGLLRGWTEESSPGAQSKPDDVSRQTGALPALTFPLAPYNKRFLLPCPVQ